MKFSVQFCNLQFYYFLGCFLVSVSLLILISYTYHFLISFSFLCSLGGHSVSLRQLFYILCQVVHRSTFLQGQFLEFYFDSLISQCFPISFPCWGFFAGFRNLRKTTASQSLHTGFIQGKNFTNQPGFRFLISQTLF